MYFWGQYQKTNLCVKYDPPMSSLKNYIIFVKNKFLQHRHLFWCHQLESKV